MTASASSRREFLQAAAAAGTLAARRQRCTPPGSDVLRVGLIGCGGRGTGAAEPGARRRPERQARRHGRRLRRPLESSLDDLQKDEKIAAKIDVTPERRFVGFDAYQKVIASGVTWCCSARRRTSGRCTCKAAVEAGKHVFAEKPVAVDAPGVRSVLATCEEAKKKNLSVVSGLCLRYDNGFRETVAALHDGAIGDDPSRCRPTTTAAAAGSSRGSRTGPTWTGRCATGTTSPGSRATSTSSSTSTSSTSAPG